MTSVYSISVYYFPSNAQLSYISGKIAFSILQKTNMYRFRETSKSCLLYDMIQCLPSGEQVKILEVVELLVSQRQEYCF